MSTLQCATTLLLARPGAPERLAAGVGGRRVARVWADGDTGDDVAHLLGVGVSALPDPADDVEDVLDEIADAHPGETVLLVTDALVGAVPRACRMQVPAGPLAPGDTVEVLADADDRVCVRWGRPSVPVVDLRFDGPDLDTSVWLPHYLPAWSSRAAAAASYRPEDGALVLDVPVDHPVWCPGDHDPPLRVSGLQTGSWSGPVGSTRGQQRFREGQTVQEEQPRFEGWLPSSGRVGLTCAMTLSPRSMAALWLSGFEDDPAQEQCGELCVVEVFGKDLGPADAPSAEVGVGIKAFRDPALTQDFAAPRLPLDVTEPHTYAVEWDAAEAVFTADGQVVRRCPNPPTYPMQLMLAVFDFPEWSTGDDDHLVPELRVWRVFG